MSELCRLCGAYWPCDCSDQPEDPQPVAKEMSLEDVEFFLELNQDALAAMEKEDD